MITEAGQLAILADICDAADPALTEDARLDAALRAARLDADFAVVTATALLRGWVESVGIVFGPEYATRLMAETRAKASTYTQSP